MNLFPSEKIDKNVNRIQISPPPIDKDENSSNKTSTSEEYNYYGNSLSNIKKSKTQNNDLKSLGIGQIINLLA